MSMILIGTVKTAGVYDVKGKDGSEKKMISLSVVDGLGNVFPCQMWPDDPQFTQLVQVIEQYRRHQVQLNIVSYSVRMRQFQDGQVRPWANFVISDVTQPTSSLLSMSFTGTVKASGVYDAEGKKPMLWFTAVDEIGTGFPCQMWSDDPQFGQVAPAFKQGVRRQPVQFQVASYSLRERTFKDGKTAPQINFVVSDVSLASAA